VSGLIAVFAGVITIVIRLTFDDMFTTVMHSVRSCGGSPVCVHPDRPGSESKGTMES
jgi:hypothetical protein